MNALARWNPWSDMNDLNKRLSSLLDLAHVRNNASSSDEENMTVPEWTPFVDIIEDEKEYLIKVELPEIQKDDVKVTVEGGTLTISGERKAEKAVANRIFHRVERYYGRFVRSFNVPDDAEESKVNAEFRDGMLRVHLAKSERARPKQIEVKVG